MVFKTIIQRNVRLGEAPSYGKILLNMIQLAKGEKLSKFSSGNYKKLIMSKSKKICSRERAIRTFK